MTEIRVPTLGESVTEATIGRWFKKAGDAVAVDEPLVELETDKVTIEVPAPSAGTLGDIVAKDGETVAVGALLGQINDGAAGAAAKPPAAPAKAAAPPPPPSAAPAPAAATSKAPPADAPLAPSVRRISAESGVDAATVPGSGKDGRVTKGGVQALKDIPAANAEIDGSDLIYKNYYHIGVAVGTDKGLVVPVVRDCDLKSIAEIEKSIADYGRRARDGQLKIDEMQGGTFTITNGGIYGSLMSTPILNAPQSAILGMHKIQDRPIAIGGKVEIRPMMYLALSYDHRVIDGKEAVTFLERVKESLEDPARLVLEL